MRNRKVRAHSSGFGPGVRTAATVHYLRLLRFSEMPDPVRFDKDFEAAVGCAILFFLSAQPQFLWCQGCLLVMASVNIVMATDYKL